MNPTVDVSGRFDQTMPIPCEPWEENWCVSAWDLFTPQVLQMVIDQNARWLQSESRVTKEILSVLFPGYAHEGMRIEERLCRLNNALWDSGYRPSDRTLNPSWTFPT